MRIILTLLIYISLSATAKAQQFGYFQPGKVANCGGFVVDSSIVNKSLFGKTLIYGNITSCTDKTEAAYAVLEISSEEKKTVDTIHADKTGHYKKLIKAGTYKIWAGHVVLGSIQTPFLDFIPQTSVEVDFYLSAHPLLKD